MEQAGPKMILKGWVDECMGGDLRMEDAFCQLR